MSDVNCPYCESEQEINHDDGYGYEESQSHEQRCISCDKDFNFTTAISFNYEVFCSDGHDMEDCGSDKHPDLFYCSRCDYYEIRKGSEAND